MNPQMEPSTTIGTPTAETIPPALKAAPSGPGIVVYSCFRAGRPVARIIPARPSSSTGQRLPTVKVVSPAMATIVNIRSGS